MHDKKTLVKHASRVGLKMRNKSTNIQSMPYKVSY